MPVQVPVLLTQANGPLSALFCRVNSEAFQTKASQYQAWVQKTVDQHLVRLFRRDAGYGTGQ